MKKLFILIFIIFLLGACTPIDDSIETIEEPIETIEESIETIEPPIETTETNNNNLISHQGYASNITITESIMPLNQRLPQKYFTGSYSNIKFTPLTKELCLTANVNDKDYRNATYYLVGRLVGTSYYGEMRIQFLISSGYGSKSVCFENVDLIQPYEILLTKVDLDDLNPSSTLYSVNTLTLHDQNAGLRSRVTSKTISGFAPSIYKKGESPYIEFSTTFLDPNRSIDKAHVVLFNPFNSVTIDSQIIAITEEHYDGDTLKIENIRFNNLAPQLAYSIQIFVDGNDGIDDFEKITLESYSYETGTYENVEIDDVYHELFAVFTGIEVIEDEVFLYYDFFNDGSMFYSDTKETITFKVTTFTGHYLNRVQQSFPLDITQNHMVFSKDFLRNGLIIYIRDERNKLMFCKSGISAHFISLSAFDNTMHEIRIISKGFDIDPPLSMKVEIVDSNNQVVETIENVSTQFGEFNYPYLGTYEKNMGYIIRITYEVETIIGILTHVVEKPLFPY